MADTRVQVLVFGCASERIADAITLRRRRDAWIDAGIMARLKGTMRDASDRMIKLELAGIAVDGCMTKTPCGGEVAGRSPVDRGKQGPTRSTVVDANGIPLGIVAAPASRHDAPLLAPTRETRDELAPVPAAVTV